jgi:predicted enzyme related to lactoylglutathione lyase
MNTDTFERGVPSWVELTTHDPDLAARFYGQLFGWAQKSDVGDTPERRTYVLGDRRVAAVNSGSPAEPAAWTLHIDVADPERARRLALQAGGSAVAGVSGTVRRSLTLADHSGTRFAVRQDQHTDGPGPSFGEPGSFVRGELITDDVEASAAFYGAVFGWRPTAPEGPMRRREWLLDGRPVSGLLPRPPAMPSDSPPYWDVYFAVADAAATASSVARLGGSVLMPASGVGRGTIAVFADPAGAVFSVVSPLR